MVGATALFDLRVWRDERLGQLWRVSYNEGDGPTLVTFPDVKALGDFLSERLGLKLIGEGKEIDEHHSLYMDDDGEIVTN
ncbi:MAG: hypothetical protein HC876_10130 [Chloroflexaceae bacterium]|nr:hypothetical protein [Chloroflexaceae bacterium]NJO05840.1 hypothetical protein [Chloroflexaceae bacterium]